MLARKIRDKEECMYCGGEYGQHHCIWCLDKIKDEVCQEFVGCCESCFNEQKKERYEG
jgi:hypothetical protein